MMKFYPEGILINKCENINSFVSIENLEKAFTEHKILESKAILCDSNHNLIVDLGVIKGIIPREEVSIGIREGTVKDIAIISKVNKPVCFIIDRFEKNIAGHKTAILSRRYAQELCLKNYILQLKPGNIISAKVTHLERFGAFTDIGCGITSFLPIDTISVSRIAHANERFYVDMNIKVVIKYLEKNKIYLSHKELLGTWEENASLFSVGETVTGIVRAIENYGIFVELTPNLAGLADPKSNIKIGNNVSVYIKNIIPDKMKIKLTIINSFENICTKPKLKYFYDKDHIDSFLYSPVTSSRVIQTIFSKNKYMYSSRCYS
ncbi:MAG: 30S ribosomal protein S1 [Clostridia bacterium]|nr:30S ribosomal protein S1 [Clostridia bacterium]